MKTRTTTAFTLIEILIVVAIIAILAAIAVPNFLEAQTRAKVTRGRADLRTLATGLESYHVDQQAYPPNADFLAASDLFRLSTPVAYLTTSAFPDPFAESVTELPPGRQPNPDASYMYVDYEENALYFTFNSPHCMRDVYRGWSVSSAGPDQFGDGAWELNELNCGLNPGGIPILSDRLYDPTNGTVSRGDLIRAGGDLPEAIRVHLN